MNKVIARFTYQKTEYVIKFFKDKTIEIGRASCRERV